MGLRLPRDSSNILMSRMPLLAMLGVSLGVLRLIVATASWSLCVLVQISKPKISTERCLVSYIYMYIIYIGRERNRERGREIERERETARANKN